MSLWSLKEDCFRSLKAFGRTCKPGIHKEVHHELLASSCIYYTCLFPCSCPYLLGHQCHVPPGVGLVRYCAYGVILRIVKAGCHPVAIDQVVEH